MQQDIFRKLTEHDKRFDQHDADIAELKGDAKILKDDVKILKDDVKILKDDVKILKDDVRIQKYDLHRLGILHEAQEQKMAQILDIVRYIAERVSGWEPVEQRLDNHEHRIAALESAHQAQK